MLKRNNKIDDAMTNESIKIEKVFQLTVRTTISQPTIPISNLTNKMLVVVVVVVVVVCCWCTMHSIASFAEMRFMFCFIDIYILLISIQFKSFDLYGRPLIIKIGKQSYDE